MGCFDRIIGLRELCTEWSPKSGLYLNDFGVSLKLIQDVIGKDYAGPTEYLEAKIAYAVQAIKNEFNGIVGDKIRSTSVLEGRRLGVPLDDKVPVVGGGYRGIWITIPVDANYYTLDIASIDLFTNQTATIPVVVYDLLQGKLLDTVQCDAVNGEISTTYTGLSYASSGRSLQLFIGFDSTGITSYKTTIRAGQCCGNYGIDNGYIRAKGVIANTFLKSGQAVIDNTTGMSIEYSINCDPEGWMCNYSRQAGLTMAHKVASEIFRDAVMVSPTSRTNNSSTVNADLMSSNYEYHDSKYREALKSLLGRVKIPCGNICFECNKKVTVRSFNI